MLTTDEEIFCADTTMLSILKIRDRGEKWLYNVMFNEHTVIYRRTASLAEHLLIMCGGSHGQI